jgi:hypothetical protein
MERLAREQRPKLIIAGGSAYSREIDFARFRAVADEIGAALRYATVQIERTARTDSTQQQQGSRAQDSGYLVDEEPF